MEWILAILIAIIAIILYKLKIDKRHELSTVRAFYNAYTTNLKLYANCF